jgi:endoglucanase
MHKKMAKAITGSLMAATMLATTATAFVPMSAFAGSCVGQSTFEEGVGLPWHICVTNPAEQSFNISNGTYNVTIVNPGGEARGGDSRWDCQFRHRSLHIEAGHTYKVHWEVTSDQAGDLATQIATLDGETTLAWHNNYGYGDDGANEWNNVKISVGKNTFDSTFTAKETIEVAEWAFHYGGAGAYQDHDCFPAGTNLSFDNMTLECVTCGDTYVDSTTTPCLWDPTNEMGVITPRSDVRINQVGYWTNLTKKASYATDEEVDTVTFKIVDSTGATVYEGTGEQYGYDESAGEYVQILDFTDCDAVGTDFHIEVSDSTNTYTNEKTGETYQMWKSHDFDIVDPTQSNVYDGVLKNALNYYYQNRSGVAIESKYITSGDKENLAHQAGHTTDMAYVQSEWVASYGQTFDGDKTYQIDGTGGWYDAGDHGKYVVNGGISVWTLQNMYEMSIASGTDSKWTGDAMLIPESGDSVPDILDETRVELEWMFKMMVKSSDPYYGSKYTNFVYHKLHDHKWTGLATRPWDYEEEWGTTRIVKPPTYAATLNMVACAAQAARLWKGIDDTFAATCLANAKAGYDAVINEGNYKTYSSSNALFAPLDQAIGGGAYGDNYVLDDLYWAACELYITTGDSKYYEQLKTYNNTNDTTGKDKAFSLTTNLTGGENAGSFTSFNWGCTAGLGTLSLYLNSDKLTAAEKATVESSITSVADEYIAQEESEGMGIPYHGTTFTDPINIGYEDDGVTPKSIEGYEWGSNSFVVNNAIVMAYAYKVTGENKYISGTSTALDYIFGRNGLGISYVTGTGTYHTSNPHHRYWSYELDHSFPMAPDGVMSGGAGSGLQDPYVGGLGYIRGEVAPQKCYVDSIEAWSVNEVTINWNAPFAWVISFLTDEIVDAPDVDDNPTTEPTTKSDLEVTLWGDADVNGVVEIADAVAVMSYVCSPAQYPLTDQGKINADVYNNGDLLSSEDALSIQKYLANVLSELPESYKK